MLKEEGRRTAEKFLKNHGTDLGRRSTLNLDVLLQQV
jgi:NTE family protein